MTEKVASLSGGLVLGMAFAVFLGIGSNRSITSQIHLEYPSMDDLISINDFQSYHTSSSSPTTDTTGSISVSSPSHDQDQGRIIRIATVTETTDPVFHSGYGTFQENILPKNWGLTDAPKAGNALQQAYLQHTVVADASQTSSLITSGQAARQAANFAAIADNGSGGGMTTGGSDGEPPVVDNKPQPSGTPAVAHGNPGAGEGQENPGEPAMAGFSPRPQEPDAFSNNTMNCHVNPYDPRHDFTNHETEDGSHDDPGAHPGPPQLQNGHRPETD